MSNRDVPRYYVSFSVKGTNVSESLDFPRYETMKKVKQFLLVLFKTKWR